MDQGNFFVNGEEITIDYDADIPAHLMKELEKSPMNQLDAFYLRKRIHQLSSFISNATSQSEMRIADLEEAMLKQKKAEQVCHVEVIPRIVSDQIHKIVNGKFNSIDNTLKDIQSNQKSVAQSLETFNEKLMEKITYVANKTLFGAVKNAYTKHPVRTILGFGFFSIVTFVYVMATLRIHSFSEGVELLLKWFS